MILSEHDGTEIVSVSLTKYEAESIIAAIAAYLVDSELTSNRRDCLRVISMGLQNQVERWY